MTDRSDYYLHPDVEWILRPDGSSRLMHMNANVCALDAASTQLLQWLIEIGPERAAAKLVARYEVDELDARQDISAYLTDLRKHKFICPLLYRDRALEHARKVAARAFIPAALCVVDLVSRNRRLGVWGFLWAAKWTVAQIGWGTALSEWEKMYPQPVRETQANTERLEAIDRAVRETAARPPISAECKERGLACLALARKDGIPVQIIVGATYDPLQGHVWVESGGRIISDDPEHCRRFEPVARYG